VRAKKPREAVTKVEIEEEEGRRNGARKGQQRT